MIRKRFLVLLGAVLFLLAACALPAVPPNPSNPMYAVAVLPVYNATNDIDAPQKVRELLSERVVRWHYKSMPLAEADQILRDEFGITLGSQLDQVSSRQLGEALKVDGLIYAYLLNFDHITTGVYNVKKVRAGFKLVDARTGRVIWAGAQGVKSILTSGGAAGKGVAALKELQDAREGVEPFKSIQGLSGIPRIGNWRLLSFYQEESVGRAGMFALGEKLVGKALGVHLKPETDAMLNMVFTDFPAGPGGWAAVSRPIPLPEIKMPKMEAPRGGFSYFELGKRDFTADLIMTTAGKDGERPIKINGRLAKLGANFRSDVDMSEAFGEGGKEAAPPPAFLKSTFLKRADEDKTYTLYTEIKKYLEHPIEKGVKKQPKVERQKIGAEIVDGHKTEKYRVTFTDEEGKSHQGLIWEAKDLDNFVIRAEFEEEGVKQTMELKNIKLAAPPDTLFQIPADYVKAGSFMDLMTEGAEKEGK